MDVEGPDFQDWEVLHNSDEAGMVNTFDSAEKMKGLEGIEGDSEGIIRSDYFSLDSQNKYPRTVPDGDVTEEGSVESDNPSWIDPGSETRSPRKESGEFLSDLSSDRSVDCKFGEFDAKNELGIVENAKIHVGSDSSGIEPITMKFLENTEMGVSDNAGEERVADWDGSTEGLKQSVENENVATEAMKPGGEKETRNVVWWKLPLEFLKYCLLRVSPVWTFSAAAAVLGFVILVRRLNKMKRKSQSLQLKVTVDDKKVSQFRSRAARLNEAFSMVKRVPIVRPSLPAAGVTHWPVMSLR